MDNMDQDQPAHTGSMELGQLRELITDGCPVKLEAGVELGLQILADTNEALADAKTLPELAEWIKLGNDLRAQAFGNRVVVGVVGSTGAGKSSVINAVLDEECLVPTNCMRACTAVITEIGYNTSDCEDQKYRAEILFITKDEWIRELRVMFADVGDPSLVGTSMPNSESEAGIAYAKIRSVYPFLTHEQIRKCKFDVEELANHPSIHGLLDSVQAVASPTPAEFSGLLTKYIDSKDKSGVAMRDPNAIEYWPLIKVVKVFVKSPILASGLVLVDLPGVHDSNAARSAVASNYIEHCSGLWIVAPITRAVDDKVAQTLLGDSFKRQLKLDGMYSSVTVICSKADDISLTEALKRSPEEDAPKRLHALTEQREHERKELEGKLDELRGKMSSLQDEISDRRAEVQSLRTSLGVPDDEDDVVVFSPSKSHKRATRVASAKARKRQRRRDKSYHDETDSTMDEALFEEESEPVQERISREAAEQRLKETEARLDTAKAELDALRQLAVPQHKQLKELRAEIKSLTAEMKHACIKYRNDYSRPVIQAQFAEGIRETDQQNAADDDNDFDPNQAHRDYDDIAKKLPVFCVSSKAYQKISGRLENDDRVAGFARVEDTEIPALKAHALRIANGARTVTYRRFLNNLSTYLTSLHLQVVSSDQPLKLADDVKEKEAEAFQKAMKTLRKDLAAARIQAITECRGILATQIARRLDQGAAVAASSAIAIINSWICHKDDGGLAYHTFRATCVRDGVFNGAKGLMNFNEALADPMLKHFENTWASAFRKWLPSRLDTFAEDMREALGRFRLEMARAGRPLPHAASLNSLAERQMRNLQASMEDVNDLKATLGTGQRGANRLLVPVVARRMREAYARCVEEKGLGCFKRIKTHILAHITTARETMFHSASRLMQRHLTRTLDALDVEMAAKAEGAAALVVRDYGALMAANGGGVSEAVEASREGVRGVLEGVDRRFEAVLRGRGVKVEGGMEVEERVARMSMDVGEQAAPVLMDVDAEGQAASVPMKTNPDAEDEAALAVLAEAGG